MNPILRNILAVIAGIVIGSVVNMSLITVSGSIIPPPEGTDVSTQEGLIVAMPFFEPKHFIFPFLAHALGTFVGSFIASLISATHKMKFAFAISFFFLLGGIASVFMLPSPTWFTALDLSVAYLPMAYFGGKLANRKQ